MQDAQDNAFGYVKAASQVRRHLGSSVLTLNIRSKNGRWVVEASTTAHDPSPVQFSISPLRLSQPKAWPALSPTLRP